MLYRLEYFSIRKSIIPLGDIMLFKEIRKTALINNKNKYLKSILIPFFALLVTVILTVSPYLFKVATGMYENNIAVNYLYVLRGSRCLYYFSVGFLAYVFYCAVTMGEEAWYSGRTERKKYCFRRFMYWMKPTLSLKAAGLRLVLFALKAFWTILFFTPAVAVAFVIVATAFSGGIEIYLFLSLCIGALILTAIGFTFRFVIIQRYFLANYLLVSNPDLGIIQCIRQSVNLLEGHIFTVVKFKLSFLPYALACLLILPVFFVYPYYKQSRTIIAKRLIV